MKRIWTLDDPTPSGPGSSPFTPRPLSHFQHGACSHGREERDCVLDHRYPESFLSGDEFFMCSPLVSSDILLRYIRRFRESTPKGWLGLSQHEKCVASRRVTSNLRHPKGAGVDLCPHLSYRAIGYLAAELRQTRRGDVETDPPTICRPADITGYQILKVDRSDGVNNSTYLICKVNVGHFRRHKGEGDRHRSMCQISDRL